MTDLLHSEVARKGGNALKDKYGKDHFSNMGKKGAEGKLKKYGNDYYKRISKMSVEARRKRREEKAKEVVIEDTPKKLGILDRLLGK